MADKRASLILELKDLASSGIAKVTTAIGGLKTAIFGATAVLGTLVGVMAKALSSYGEQEAAVSKLNQALENQGIKSQAVTNDLVKFAEQMQKTTTYADEVVISAMALGTTFGLYGDKLKQTTQAAADMSAALGVDLKTTMLLLGKAAVGETGTLSRYGIVIGDSIPKAERFAAALSQINNRFGGSAAAQAGTYAGQVIQLKNAFGELMETLGSFLVGPATSFLKWLNSSATAFKEYIVGPERLNGIYQKQIDNLRQLIALKEKEIQMAAEEGVTGTRKEEELARMEKALAWYETQDRMRMEAQAKEVNDTAQHNANLKALDEQRTLEAKKQADARAKNLVSTLQFIGTMSTSHNRTLATIGKAAAISTATIDTYAAANKALASAPPPWNIALAALVTAAGMANVASISGVKLAEGGMIMPKSGGTSAIMAEAGRPEVAIPLDDERTKDKLRDTLGGAGTTIIVQAGAVIADEYSLDEFARKIDEKLFERQRNRRSYL